MRYRRAAFRVDPLSISISPWNFSTVGDPLVAIGGMATRGGGKRKEKKRGKEVEKERQRQ